ncbi:MAG: helix-turn-helix transcriptional regulator [Parabacteroides sp.]|nr:helix-turn-helix transcriptional regulator [Parabacteroides sp.]
MQRRKRLIFWRIERRLKQKDIAEQLGITPAHYSNIERGITDPSYELLTRFTRVFNDEENVIYLFEKGEDIEWGL